MSGKQTPSQQTTSPTAARRPARPALWVGSVFSALVLVAISALAFVGPSLSGLTDQAGSLGTQAVAQQVSQTLTTQYCPTKVGVSDQAAYGDTQFTASEGDLTSAVQLAGLGSVYSSALTALSGSPLANLKQGKDAFALGGQAAELPLLLSTTLLSPQRGTGSLGTVASWASTGDVRGLAATDCTNASLSSTFLVPSTQTGAVANLSLANPSDKPLAVSLSLHGTQSAEPIVPSTGSTVTVPANSQRVVNLSAAAPGQEGLLVQVQSQSVPIFTTLSLSRADGLTPKGVDYIPQLGSAQTQSVLPGLEQGQRLTVRSYSTQATDLDLSWLGEHGAQGHRIAHAEAGRVSVIDLGTVPPGVGALRVTSTTKSLVAATVTVGDSAGQQDFTDIVSSPAQPDSALTVPDGLQASLVLVNGGQTAQSVHLEAFDGSGDKVGEKGLSLPAGSSKFLPLSDMDKTAVTVHLRQGKTAQVAWSAILTAPNLQEAKVAQAAVLRPTSLMPQILLVNASRSLLLGLD